MLSSLMMFIKLVTAYIGGFKVMKGDFAYAPLLAVPAFLTGIEMNTDSEEPWWFLLSGQASAVEIQQSLFGGIALVAICMAIVYGIHRYIDEKDDA